MELVAVQHWYTSPVFWTAAVVPTTILAACIGAFVVYLVAVPSRRLLYGMPVVAPLLSAPRSVRNELEVRHNGQVLTEPHLLEVHFASRGRTDIGRDAFDDARPIRFDLGATIVAITQVTSTPSSCPAPQCSYEGAVLSVGPGLINRRQRIVITLLVDGAKPDLVDVAIPLTDVRTQRSTFSDERSRSLRSLGTWVVVTAIALFMSAGTALFVWVLVSVIRYT